MNANRKAFSLVELLTVVAIIILLLALLFPLFGEVRERGRQVSCLGNLKAQGTGLIAYAAEHDGSISRYRSVEELAAAGAPYGGWNYHGWFMWPVNPAHSVMLSYYNVANEFWCGSAGLYNQSYVKDPRAFYCPGDKVRRVTSSADGEHFGRYGFYRRSDADPKIWMSYSFNPAQSFRIGDDMTTRVGGGYSKSVYPFKYGRHNAILLMDPVSYSTDLTYHRNAWMTFNYDGSGSRRGSGELSRRLKLLAPESFNSWSGFDNEVLPLLVEDAR